MADTVKTYIEKVLELRETSEVEAWTEEELKEIAREIGLTDDELAAIDKRVNDSAERALGFMKHELWSEAVNAWQDALSFAPSRTKYQLKLAETFIARNEGRDHDDAKGMLDAVLIKEPSNTTAYELLKRLKTGTDMVAVQPEQSNTDHGDPSEAKRRRMLMPIAGAIISLGAAVGVMVTVEEGVDQGGTDRGHIIEPNAEERVKTHTTHKGDFPLETETPYGIEIEIHESVYDVHPDSSFYKMKALIVNNTGKEIESIQGEFSYVLKDGTQVEQKEILGTHEAPMRPGDKHPMSDLEKLPTGQLERVILKPTLGPQTAAGTYAEPEPMAVKYGDGIDGSRFKLKIAERSESLGSKSVIGRYHRVAWEFLNDGGPTIRTIRVRVDYVEKGGKVFETKDFLVTYSGEPPIEPGETRVKNTIQNVKSGEFDHYDLTIIEIN